MRPKRKVFYEVTSPTLWYVDGIGWSKDIPEGHGASSNKRYYTATKAFKVADKLPVGTIVMRFYRHKGEWLIREWEKYK